MLLECNMCTYMNRKKIETARKKQKAVAITASLVGSKKPEKLSEIEDLVRIAFDVIDWEDSNASTICESDIEELKNTSPQFGVLDERNGRKIYGIFGNHNQDDTIIKKLVVPLYSGVFLDEEVVPLIEKYFPLTPIHRKKTK